MDHRPLVDATGAPSASLALITVSYGHAEALLRLLDRVRPDLGPTDEIVIVDNGSDGVAERLGAPHPAIRVITPGQNTGFAAGCNRGAEATSADVLLFLNPDCLPEPGFLNAIRDAPADWSAWMGLVTTGAGERVNTAGGVTHFTGIAWSGRFDEHVSRVGHEPAPVGFLSGACMAVRRAAWEEIGGFAEDFFMYGEDVDISHRLRLAGHRFGLVPAARVRHDYEFDKGADKWRYLERNRWLTIVRTYPASLLAVVLPALLALEPILLLVALRGGWAPQKLRSWAGVAGRLPGALRSRREIQGQRSISAREFSDGLSAELSSPFLGALGESALARSFSTAYWTLARGLLGRRR